MLIASAVAIVLVVAAFVVFRLFFSLEKNSRVIVRTEKRSPFVLESMTDTDAVLYCSVPFENLGGQYGTETFETVFLRFAFPRKHCPWVCDTAKDVPQGTRLRRVD